MSSQTSQKAHMQSDLGLLISFDGPPRSGRTHQADALAATLTADGHDVVRASMPTDIVPLAKTTLAWVEERVGAYATLAREVITPALERGALVILDGGITSVLIRARAVLAMRAPLGFLYLFDQRAMRAAEVDLEYIFMDEREGERKSPGFDCASLWKAAACSHQACGAFPDSTSCGARRHATYLLRAKHADVAMVNFPGTVTRLMAERMDPAWEAVVAEAREERDAALITRRMAQWSTDNPMPLYGVVANWGAYDDATRLALIHALPTRAGVGGEFLRILTAAGFTAPAGAVGEALATLDQTVAAMEASPEGA